MQFPAKSFILLLLVPFSLEVEKAGEIGWIEGTIVSMKSFQIRHALHQAVDLGMIVASALMIWKTLMCVTGSESPIVVVLSESMEPGFRREYHGSREELTASLIRVLMYHACLQNSSAGRHFVLAYSQDPIRVGEIVVYNVDGRNIPIVHRVIKVHEKQDTGEVDILTKGDNNDGDDLPSYASNQLRLQQQNIMGRAVGFLPYVGWPTIIMTETINKVHSYRTRFVHHYVKRLKKQSQSTGPHLR